MSCKKKWKLCRMHRKWINEKAFVTDIVFRYTITVCHSLLWLPEEKHELVLLFYHISQSCKCQWMKIRWRYFVPKIIHIGLDLLELFDRITGPEFFETRCSSNSSSSSWGLRSDRLFMGNLWMSPAIWDHSVTCHPTQVSMSRRNPSQ